MVHVHATVFFSQVHPACHNIDYMDKNYYLPTHHLTLCKLMFVFPSGLIQIDLG